VQNKILVIAEIGVNHNRDLKLAFDMIDAAASTGADIIKFQTAIPELVQTSDAPKAAYQEISTADMATAMDMTRSFHFEHETFATLKAEVESYGCEFLSTAFDLKSLSYLSTLNPKRYKIPSGEMTNQPYLKAIAKTGKPVIMSTGLCTFEEVAGSIEYLVQNGTKRELLSLLQCTTSYPTPDNEVNLAAMAFLREEFGLEVGLSDHSVGVTASVAAAALGATIIEKHFTIDKDLPGPDQKTSLEPNEFRDMVDQIRRVELMIGSGSKSPSEAEIGNMDAVRRGVYLANDLGEGHVIREEDLVCLRPLSEVPANKFDEVLGKRLTKSLPRQHPLQWSDFG
jgi:sialic acid synthase SpsE